ncbi:MAG TPA: hypothetical protein VFA98_00680, partial [Thermoanaerobaculia bacterium]|nr:hypothetical protein [Thermoanaerobaculia bacterium]
FVFSNYFYGPTAIRFWPYVFASLTGLLPLTFLYVSFGAAARGALVEPAGPSGTWRWALLAAGIVVTTIATLYARRIVKRALEKESSLSPLTLRTTNRPNKNPLHPP